ncbi:vesicle-associated membrane protein 2-like protein [Leptotrombidium deliense]|uniref:Vesicle-associated membrane protein 2-like protein n=1 Tax=Leptotrombidium deliense TaxID=299467 RepID=A0A443S726_9ACAR|nr:vesicle-associated membrane protein 2-like protein [Leptotrombidium deliense]
MGYNNPLIPLPVNTEQQASSTDQQQTEAKVDQVIGIMESNVENVLQREEQLCSLNNRAAEFQTEAAQPAQQTSPQKRKYCGKHWWKFIVALIPSLILILRILKVILYEIRAEREREIAESFSLKLNENMLSSSVTENNDN